MMSDEQDKWGDWIEWNGGKCPVDDDVAVSVMLRFGSTMEVGDRPSRLRWEHDGCPSDIAAYRIVRPASPAAGAPSSAPADTHSTIVTRLHIVPSGETLDSENALSVSIVEGGAADYVEIERGGNNGLLQIDASEWPRLRDAVDQIVKNARG